MKVNESRPRIVVSGYGSISAAGTTASEAQAGLHLGTVTNRMAGREFFPPDFVAPCFQVTAELSEPLTGSDYIHCGHLTDVNRTIQLALTAIVEALGHAGLSPEILRRKRVGVALGTTVGCSFHNEDYYRQWRRGKEVEPGPLFTYLSSNLAARVQNILRVSGPRAVITNACGSGTDAIGVAREWLEHGLCDIAIGGGADELSRVACHGFKSLMLVSEKSCQPFDRDRQGLNLGEGAGVFVMERESDAIARKGAIQGWVLGYGTAGDGYHPTAPHPQGRGLQLAMHKALADGNRGVAEIGMINAHGTGTRANDPAEAAGLVAAGFCAESVAVVSTKGITGHTLGAAGGVEAVFALMALNRGEVTGTVGCHIPDPALGLSVLKQGERDRLRNRLGISQSLAFGGSNSVLIIEGAGT